MLPLNVSTVNAKEPLPLPAEDVMWIQFALGVTVPHAPVPVTLTVPCEVPAPNTNEDGAKLKPPCGLIITTIATVRDTPPPLAVTFKVYVPLDTPFGAFTVTLTGIAAVVEGVTCAGVNVAPKPDGTLEAAMLTALVKPPIGCSDSEAITGVPGCTDSVPGPDNRKPGELPPRTVTITEPEWVSPPDCAVTGTV